MTVRSLTALLIAAALLGPAGPAAANEQDKREVSAYVLTEGGLAKFAQATQNLAAIPGACVEKGEDDEEDQSERHVGCLITHLAGSACEVV